MENFNYHDVLSPLYKIQLNHHDKENEAYQIIFRNMSPDFLAYDDIKIDDIVELMLNYILIAKEFKLRLKIQDGGEDITLTLKQYENQLQTLKKNGTEREKDSFISKFYFSIYSDDNAFLFADYIRKSIDSKFENKNSDYKVSVFENRGDLFLSEINLLPDYEMSDSDILKEKAISDFIENKIDIIKEKTNTLFYLNKIMDNHNRAVYSFVLQNIDRKKGIKRDNKNIYYQYTDKFKDHFISVIKDEVFDFIKTSNRKATIEFRENKLCFINYTFTIGYKKNKDFF